jgi:hypothetical protein
VLQALLCLLPALALAIPLLARRYPGERVLLALRREPAAGRWPRARSASSAAPLVVLVPARGGRLIGRSLAVRPPPSLLATS